VIDGERRIRYRWVTDDALVEPDLEEALTSIESLASSPQGISGEP
jgi:hypothetical protein